MTPVHSHSVQILSWNTGLQPVNEGLPQNLRDWLGFPQDVSSTLQVASFLARSQHGPDIVAVGFQELLPLHLGLAGLTKAVMSRRSSHIHSQIEANAPNKERYSLLAKVVNGGVALLVFAKDEGIGQKIRDVETTWTSLGPLHLANKAAVGVRFRVVDSEEDAGQIYTFVCAHLTAHEPNLQARIGDYQHITGSLLFSPLPGATGYSTIYDTSHLFFFGDLNFRVHTRDLLDLVPQTNLSEAFNPEATRETIKNLDQLLQERKKGNVFIGCREGEFWKFKPTYKYEIGKVDAYSGSRTPAWTDRILYATHSDSPDTPEESNIKNILYTSVPSYTSSDHKPIVSLLLLPPHEPSSSIPLLQLPPGFTPRLVRYHRIKRILGRLLDRIIGLTWWLFAFIGAGSVMVGFFNILVTVGGWGWWKSSKNPRQNV